METGPADCSSTGGIHRLTLPCVTPVLASTKVHFHPEAVAVGDEFDGAVPISAVMPASSTSAASWPVISAVGDPKRLSSPTEMTATNGSTVASMFEAVWIKDTGVTAVTPTPGSNPFFDLQYERMPQYVLHWRPRAVGGSRHNENENNGASWTVCP